MLRNALFKWLVITLCFGNSVSVLGAGIVSYPQLEQYIQNSQYEKAYQRALVLRQANEGDPRFDYLYGLSALQTGHYNEAVFALDRVTVSTPNVIRPRLELARAYLKLNNKTAAIKEFNDVLNLRPPPKVKAKVLIYLAELKKANPATQTSITRRLASFSIGYDDNINFGSDNDEIDLPGFGLVALDPAAVKQKSGFAEAKFQLRHRRVSSKTNNTFFVANVIHRSYFKNTDFDYTDLDLRTGITINRNTRQYQLMLRDRPIFLDGELHSNTFGVDGIVRHSLGNGKILSTSLSLEKYDNQKISLSDRQRALLGVSLDKNSGVIQHQVNLHLGKEWPDKSEGKQFSRDIFGVGYRASRKWNSNNKTFLNLDYRQYTHQAPYPVFPERRKDDRFIIKAIHEWQYSDKATVVFSARHINNKSNLELYDAKRNEVSVGIRYEWD